MFQRLKGAFDTIADLAEEPQARARPSRAASSQTRLPSRTLSPRNATRQRTPDTWERTTDPDPATFAIDLNEDAPAPKPENGEQPSGGQGAAGSGKTDEGDGPTGDSKGGEGEEPSRKADRRSTDLPDDVKTKLRKLDKLEGKYQELLRAYRKAHARNAAILPFEASLRENTPLTSINDPGALVEYLSQLNLKGDMVMDELKRMSGEKDTLKKKLEEAKQETKDAMDEVTKLKAEKEDPTEIQMPRVPAGPTLGDAAEATVAIEASTVRSAAARDPASLETSSSIVSEQPLDRGVPPIDISAAAAGLEVGRLLQTAEQEQVKIIEVLRSDKYALEQDRVETWKTIEGLRQELSAVEAAKNEMETSLKSRAESGTELQKKHEFLANLVISLKLELETAKANLGSTVKINQDLQDRLASAENEGSKANDEEVATATAESLGEVPGQVSDPVEEPEDASGATKKKKTKKKKKKTTATTNVGAGEDSAPKNVSTVPTTTPTPVIAGDTTASIGGIDKDHVEALKEKDAIIEKLLGKLKDEEELLEEINTLRDRLVEVGSDHVIDKEQILALQREILELKGEIERLEALESETRGKVASAETDAGGARQQLEQKLAEWKTKSDILRSESEGQTQQLRDLETKVAKHEAIKASTEAALAECKRQCSSEVEGYKEKTRTLETDVSAAQQLAASRYKELAQAKDTLQKLQPEISLLRSEVSELKKSKSELDTANARLRRLETKEGTLHTEINTLKRQVLETEAEAEKLRRETSRLQALEESTRQFQTDMQRVSNEKAEVTAAKDDLTEDLKKTQGELRENRARVRQFESQLEESQKDMAALRQDIASKAAQHDNAVKNVASARDQAAEMATQMREAKERCESLEEELTDAHRLMNERAREGETMRRLLAEVEGRAEIRVKELKERMEVLTQERDRAEDEASAMGRRRTRELEDLKIKLRDVERELKHASDDKLDVQRNEKQLRRQLEDDGRKVVQAIQEVSEVRAALVELRTALDESEKQCREIEVEKTELKRAVDDTHARLEKAQKSQKATTDELRSMRATRIRPVGSDAASTRSSIDSARITSPISGGRDSKAGSISHSSFSSAGIPGIDYVYLKNVLLQFLEQKDKSHQMQLIPVLSMLLHFDRKDEQRWMTAIGSK